MGVDFYFICNNCELQIQSDRNVDVISRFLEAHYGHKIALVSEHDMKHEMYYFDKIDEESQYMNKYIDSIRFTKCSICGKVVDTFHNNIYYENVAKRAENGTTSMVGVTYCEKCYKPKPPDPLERKYEDEQTTYWMKKLYNR